MGARFQVPLSPKLLVNILGDAGGWGAGAGVGYRYVFVNYRPGNFIYDTALSAAIVGLNYSLK